MTQDETLALFAKGKDAWNAWAQKLLSKKSRLEAAGKWKVGRRYDHEWGLSDWGGEREEGENAETQAWLNDAAANFYESHFEEGYSNDITLEYYDTNFSGLIFPGETDFRYANFTGNTEFDSAKFFGRSSFRGAKFNGYNSSKGDQSSDIVSFHGAQFAGSALFDLAQLCLETLFDEVQFLGSSSFQEVKYFESVFFKSTIFKDRAWFAKAQFMDTVSFERAKFHENSCFDSAKFLYRAIFDRAEFLKAADFSYTTYSGPYNSFDNVCFSGQTYFYAINVERAFEIEGTRFNAVPDFIQAHFAEAPRLDNLTIAAPGKSLGLWLAWKNLKAGRGRVVIRLIRRGAPLLHPANATARYRALRRLAMQGLDHDNERIFLKGEILSRRFTLDNRQSFAFWFGVGYEWFSDFGGSIARPICWGMGSIIIFSTLYYGFAFPGTCGGNFGETCFKALYLSLKNSTLLISWDGDIGISKVTICLNEAKDLSFGTAFLLGIIQITQKICSATLLFLFALAVRNRFKIK